MAKKKTEINPDKTILTKAGLEKIEQEYKELKDYLHIDIAQKLKEAREQGDLSENAEYDAAMDEQRDIEARIEEIQKILKHAEVVDEEEVSTDAVGIGCRVTVFDIEYDEELEFAIVGSTEANSRSGKISNESPVGKALMGAKVDEVVTVVMPGGEAQYKVLKIERNVPKSA